MKDSREQTKGYIKLLTLVPIVFAAIFLILIMIYAVKSSIRWATPTPPQAILSISEIPAGHRHFPPNATHIIQLGEGWYVYRVIIFKREYVILQHYVDQDRISMTVLESKNSY